MQPRRPHESDREHEGRYEHHDHHHNYSGTVTLKMFVDAGPSLTRLIQLFTQQSETQHGEIMATLLEVQDATRISGDAARTAIMRVGEDVQELQRQIMELIAGATELADLKAGLAPVVTDLGTMTAELAGLDPLPGHPAPSPPPVEPPVEPPTT